MRGLLPPVKSVSILSMFVRGLTWTMPNAENSIFLTFDDGPIPDVTPFVLDLLERKNIKATFFCIGENVKKNPLLYQRILEEGHSVGNHTQHHLSGWTASNTEYYKEIEEANKYIKSDLFRPPYGKISPLQINHVKSSYKIIMWDILSEDYDDDKSHDQVLSNVLDHVKSGSIIVMHDNIKAQKNLRSTLEIIIDTCIDKGYHFKAMPYLAYSYNKASK
jgi:peptidoglycan-N-acetylglucosamine deacetylase